MTEIVLTQYSGKILGPIARFFGWIMNGIYMFFSNTFGVESIALSIIILTMLIYLCMFPLTLKQQKFSKLTQKMQPELQAIQKKYGNRKDQASMMAMQEETQTGSCPDADLVRFVSCISECTCLCQQCKRCVRGSRKRDHERFRLSEHHDETDGNL